MVATSLRVRILIAFAAAVLIGSLAYLVRGYPWELAAISGALIGVLVFVTLQTVTRLRATLGQFRRP